MKNIVWLLAVFGSCTAFGAAPEIVEGSVSLTKGAAEVVKIAYTLTGEPAVVTVDIQTNTAAGASGEWVSIGGEAMGMLGGEANKMVYALDEPVAAYWFPSVAFRDRNIAAGGIRAEVTAWPTNCPPDYMTIDLTAPTSTAWIVRRFYTSTNALPGGFTNIAYKTTQLLMRKIPAAGVVWWMGAPANESGSTFRWDVRHKVMLTEDYYAAVYETTQAQYKNINGSLGSCSFTTYVDSPVRPFQKATVPDLRGINKSTITGYWPENGHTVTATSVIGKLRQKCGIADIDLPTETQWEYACRAGVGAALYNGQSYSAGNLNPIAWHQDNVSETVIVAATGASETKSLPHVVGTKLPNAWGLYDMLGNVFEFCLDRFEGSSEWSESSKAAEITAAVKTYTDTFEPGWDDAESPSVTTNPVGIAKATVASVVKRGGAWMDNKHRVRSGARTSAGVDYTGASGYIGFRLFCSVKEAVK